MFHGQTRFHLESSFLSYGILNTLLNSFKPRFPSSIKNENKIPILENFKVINVWDTWYQVWYSIQSRCSIIFPPSSESLKKKKTISTAFLKQMTTQGQSLRRGLSASFAGPGAKWKCGSLVLENSVQVLHMLNAGAGHEMVEEMPMTCLLCSLSRQTSHATKRYNY